MPIQTKHQCWLNTIGDHIHEVQRAQLDQELDSESSPSLSDSSHGDNMDIDINKDLGDDFHIDLDELVNDPEITKLELEAELLDMELDVDGLLGHVGSPEFNIERSPSPTSSDIAEEVHQRWNQCLNELVGYITSNRVFDPHPAKPKASQLPLLDQWTEHNIRNFWEKL